MKIENLSGENAVSLTQVVIISGKGGTGKTTLTAAFTKLAHEMIVADCDVDAADLHIVLKPEISNSFQYQGGRKAVIDLEKCTQCGLCEEYCRFNAIFNFRIDTITCEGCGFCYHICPENAIDMRKVISGYYHICNFPGGDFVYAALEPGEGNSGKLVSEVKRQANNIAEDKGKKWFLVDGPPGIGCPVNASLSQTDFIIIITEPTVSGLHDLQRVVELIQRFNIPSAVVVNKYDLNHAMTHSIEEYSTESEIKIAGKIPFDETVERALIVGRNIMEFGDSPAAIEIFNIWENIKRLIKPQYT